MVKRPTILRIGPRLYRIVDHYFVPIGQDVRPAGLALVAVSITLLIFVEVDFLREPLIPTAIITLGILGVLVVVRARLWPHRETLVDVNLSSGVMRFPEKVHNGSGAGEREIDAADVDELLFVMREVPVDPDNPRSITIDAFGLYVRTFEEELVPVVEASLDHDRTFRTARFLADALDVGIKQVGKGWRSE